MQGQMVALHFALIHISMPIFFLDTPETPRRRKAKRIIVAGSGMGAFYALNET